MLRKKSTHELRCFCSRRPLLATYGLDERRRLYVHVRVYKQARVYGEVIVFGGEVRLHCRDCLRWHRVVFRQPNEAVLREEQLRVPGVAAAP